MPVSRIPPAKTQDLLNIKKRLGLPDPASHPGPLPARRGRGSRLADEGITLMPPRPCACALAGSPMCGAAAGGHEDVDVDEMVREVTEAVMAALQARGR